MARTIFPRQNVRFLSHNSGKGELTYQDGKTYAGSFSNGKMEGKGRMT
jgi:hypothetical protein